ncbi:MAG: aminopeptidase [Oscillospiraceae bacterium]|nr:aminopeptidase [Oscillospiraceae bacterium]
MAKKENSVVKELEKELLYKRKNVCKTMSTKEIQKADDFCEDYKTFLDEGKTERKACDKIVEMAKSAGFVQFETGKKYSNGDKLYAINRDKAVTLCVIGEKPIVDGLNLIASHIDSPRLDLKQNPLYEDNGLVYFKTHYYGGIKKYQWPAIPLALHGVVVKADGSIVKVTIGEDDCDPVFTVTDLLPHLADAQYKRPSKDLIKGEELNILIGSRPFKADEESGTAKLAIMKLLHDKYGITERDFTTAELEAVPAFKSRDVGFDRSIICGYGQDDRVCAYTSLMAILGIAQEKTPAQTALCVFADKEEIGSYGNTGLGSNYLEYFIMDLVAACSDCNNTDFSQNARRCFENSKCLSADVCAALDPTFPDVVEKNNCGFINHGTVIGKYFGSRGKSGTNDASAEYLAKIRKLYDDAGVVWQTGELGKVDAGGGGTVAMYVARMNIDTVDVGVPVLSMHSPMELTSKADVYMAYRGFKAFYVDE